MKVLQAFIFYCLLIRLSGCLTTKPNPQDLAATAAAETAAAASPMPTPTETALPTITFTPTLTFTPTATSSPVPSPTQTPFTSSTPTPTITQGPLIFKDDFSREDSSTWTNCKVCNWKDGKLLIGPYAPGNENNLPHIITCETCGLHTYYRIAVDVALAAGKANLSFGLVIASNENELVMLGIDASQNCIVALYDAVNKNWQLLNADPNLVWNSMLKAGKKTNHLEVIIKPSIKTAGKVDYFVNLNGSPSFVIEERPAAASQVGLLVDNSNLQISFSNFEYEELIP